MPFDLFRYAVFGVVALLALSAGAAMLVQRRAINPFGRPARAIRDLTDPLLKPIERRLLRGGGNPQNAPWWLVAVAIVGGIVMITTVEWLIHQGLAVVAAAAHGGRGLAWLLVDWTFRLLLLALIVRVIASWFGVSRYARWMRPFRALTEWILAPLRQALPPFGPFDVSPLVAFLLLSLLRSVVLDIL
jgi:YggT family protein